MVGASVAAVSYNLSSYGSVRAQTKLPSGHTLSVVRNDLTQEKVDAIVNAGFDSFFIRVNSSSQ